MSASEESNHGNTPAAWATVVIIMLGFLVGGVGLVLGEQMVFYGGGVIILLGAVVGKILQAAGLGKRA